MVKNPIFMFILGGIFFGGAVFATMTITADQIEYSDNVSVKDKIDDLYTKVKPTYSGVTTITPSNSTQVLSTKNKSLNTDITVNSMPDLSIALTSVVALTSSNRGIALIYTSSFSNFYKYFTVTSFGPESNSGDGTCQLIAWTNNVGERNLTVGTKYSINDYHQIISRAIPSSTSASRRCSAHITFSNN